MDQVDKLGHAKEVCIHGATLPSAALFAACMLNAHLIASDVNNTHHASRSIACTIDSSVPSSDRHVAIRHHYIRLPRCQGDCHPKQYPNHSPILPQRS
jgi:hypothetical protein